MKILFLPFFLAFFLMPCPPSKAQKYASAKEYDDYMETFIFKDKHSTDTVFSYSYYDNLDDEFLINNADSLPFLESITVWIKSQEAIDVLEKLPHLTMIFDILVDKKLDVSVLNKLPNLHSLGLTLKEQEIPETILSLEQLHWLRLTSNKIPKNIEQLTNFKYLYGLFFMVYNENRKNTLNTINRSFSVFYKMDKLYSLDFELFQNFKRPHVEYYFSDSLLNLQQLKELIISEFNIFNDENILLLSKLPNLKILSISVDGSKKMPSNLNLLNNLEKLDLYVCNLKKSEAEVIYNTLKIQVPNIKQLSISFWKKLKPIEF